VEHGFGVVITSVACDGLDESWLGELLTEQSLAKLIELSNKFRFNVDGEGGEYETLIVHGPHFSGSIKIEGEKQWLGRRGQYKINKISNSFDGFSS
jgi:diphthamide synthase (EF-2-diphthine--ammonia ligase)